MSKISVNIAGVEFKNPVIPASGSFGFGREYENLYPLSALGGISVKGMTLNKKAGNPPPRIAETASGMLNSVGLQNPGVKAFIKDELPYLKNIDTKIIANVAGSTVEECIEIVRLLDSQPIDMIELNISCPNVKAGGAQFSASCESAAMATKAVRGATKKPLMVKLSPNVTDIASIAKAVESEGADALSLINTILGMRIDINTRTPTLKNNFGGLSGPAVFPVALRMVCQVYNAVSIPIMGMGGIEKWQDAIEMMMVGATAVQLGAALFYNAYAPIEIVQGISEFLDKNNIKDINEIIGAVKLWS